MIDDLMDGYEQLKEIGSQKLHEDTHIPKEHTRGLVDASFSKMNKIVEINTKDRYIIV